MVSAAPSAPPASPAAGCTQMFSNLPSRNTLPFATQLSATPPARHRFCFAGLHREAAGEAQHHLFDYGLDRRREVHVALLERRCGLARRSIEQRVEAIVRHRKPGAVVEIVEIEAKRTVGLEVDQIVVDELGVFRRSVGREPHHLVLAGIDLESGVISERGIEQAETVGKVDFLLDLQLVAVADRPPMSSPIRRRRPSSEPPLAEKARDRTPKPHGSNGAPRR